MPLRELKSALHADPVDAKKTNLALQGSDQDFGGQELFVLSKQTAESGSVASIAVLSYSHELFLS